VGELPRGTVTFLFTDIERSTRLLHELGDGYAAALAEHRRALRESFRRHGGVEVDTQGGAFFVAFGKASEALAAAAEGTPPLLQGRSGCEWVFTPARRSSPTRVTSESTCIVRLHSVRLAGDGHRGATLIGAAEALRDEIGFAFQDDLRRDHERLEAAFISTLGAGNFAAFRERGRELGLDGAVVFALAEID
jgi:Adenylate and Guanylate cyclase catalytic domain